MKDKDSRENTSVIVDASLRCDGGSRGNPGSSGIAYVLDKTDVDKNKETISYGGWYIGQATNNQAEYHALIWGLENALFLQVRRIEIELDSELLVKQINGAYLVKNKQLKELYAVVMQLLAKFYSFNVTHVKRAFNNEADTLANRAMDERSPVGNYHVEYVSPDNLSTVDLVQSSPVLSTSPTSDERRMSTMGIGTYYLRIKEHFDAAHALIGYPGECKNLHGHTWDVEVEVKGTKLDDVGIVYDFKDLKDDLLVILKQFDHKYLNEVEPFTEFNATAENLARVVYEQMEAKLPDHIDIVEIAVWESPVARLVYRVE
ncbi:MAG: 6-carboxytetrahydropterin synthase QueD [Coriobacteriia bacterium]|nr:6-carboxytetrahydropterin synthase QueD [Coriobacteriia bacterium]